MTAITKAIAIRLYTLFYRSRFKKWGKGAHIVPRALKLYGLEYISVGEKTHIDKGIQLTAWKSYGNTSFYPNIEIGNYCTIRPNTHISAINSIIIGDHLLTGTNVFITYNSHGKSTRESLSLPPNQRPLYSKGPVVIGNNVWLGNNVCIMPGVTIGDNVVIGANSVVTHNIPSYSIAAGVPAKIIKQL
jgi:acetyltransferase-like isoleucine patch superfamily enzyme